MNFILIPYKEKVMLFIIVLLGFTVCISCILIYETKYTYHLSLMPYVIINHGQSNNFCL